MKRAEAIYALRGMLEAGRECPIETHGISMAPFLQAGDVVQVERISPAELGIGDLIAFQQEGSLFVHRFVGRVDRSGISLLRQKGDNQRGHGLVQPEELVGRVVRVTRGAEQRFLLRGKGLLRNRLLGLRAWGFCLAMERAAWTRAWVQGRVGGLRLEKSPGPARIPREQEVLILATTRELSVAEGNRMEALLGEGFPWPALVHQGARFGLLPLLHHHLSRPGLAARVPEDVRDALARAYHLTSLKNLRMLGLLRRILLKAEAAGVGVILLKGAYLARWVYGDVGLRPMNDIDLLCRKEDEPALRTILEGMGGFRSNLPSGGEPDPSSVVADVQEKLGHSAPWWFPEICRIEVHYHLLAQTTVDDAWLLDALWSRAVTLDWDGLPARTLAPEHLLIHLASHLQHHLDEQAFNLYWFADVRETLRLSRAALDHPAMEALARRLGLEQDCARVFGLLGAPWGGASGQDAQEAARELARLMETALRVAAANTTKRTIAGYLSVIGAVRHVPGVLNKARYLRDLCFPPAWKLARTYGTTSRRVVPLLYLVHPFARLLEGLRGTIQHVQRRMGH